VNSRHSITVSGQAGFPVTAVRRAVAAVLTGEQRVADISITFLGVAAMQRLNHEHKRHDRPTDVIAFALPQPDGALTGDLYLCRGVAAREAHDRGIPVRQELLRLVIHGTLHVLGHDHPVDGRRETSAMWRLQERYLGTIA
jgi:probable rRNA maturation factor